MFPVTSSDSTYDIFTFRFGFRTTFSTNLDTLTIYAWFSLKPQYGLLAD